MARVSSYRVGCTQKCLQAQNDALNSTFFILRQTGPTAFVIKGNDERIFKVFLGDQHQCTCFAFQRDRELCKHICWLLLKRFRIPRTNPILWQRGLVEREINELLRGLTSDDDERYKLNHNYRHDIGIDVNNIVEQRPISENDVCPICQDEFLIKKLPVTYCRHGCGNNVHIKCMKIWLDHQVSTGEKKIKCPLCREIFGTPEQLKEEFRTNDDEQTEKFSIHLGYSCHRCRSCPIRGKCYKCTTCQDYFLCQTCFNLNIHNEHSFDYREKSYQRWKIAIREHLTALPNAIHQMIVNRELNENDYEILHQLETAQNTTIQGIPENIVKLMPTELVHEHSRLLEHGEQCRICLRSYQIGDRLRRLPCRHKFHIDCIDGWLLHSHPTCPVDGEIVWSAEINNEQKEIKRPSTSIPRHRTKNVRPSTSSSLLSADMGLTISPYRIRSRINTDLNQRFRHLHMRAPLRSLITSMPIENSVPLEINTRRLRNKSKINNVEQQSLLISNSSIANNINRRNNEFNDNWTVSSNSFNYSIAQRRYSNSK
ncbi:unnamed protein product [Adineta steineri]|uniref:Uncharacterized protein n=1 Tax=Adineta steineri TaxID=433720 RepID=A0A819GSU4_9BILA|nr:unnamed protein product [Adineta steineri]